MKKYFSFRKWSLAAVCMMVAVLVSLGSVIAASAATNKALKIENAVFKKGSERNNLHGAELSAALLKNDKLKKSGMTFSADVYIPVKALQKAGDQLNVDGYIYLQDPKAGNNNKTQTPVEEWPHYKGFIETKYDIILRLDKNKKLELIKRNWSSSKESKAGKYVSVSKKGSYYVVKLKNLPLTDYYPYPMPEGQHSPSMDTKTKYLVSPSVIVVSSTKKAWKGNLYIDNLKVKTATKTQKITFNKKDYRGLYVSNWANSNGHNPILVKPMK